MPGPRFDLPNPDHETQPYWDAARAKKLLIKRCGACGRAHFYPRPFCPHCWSNDVSWEQASGRATLYTYSIVHRNDLPPFNERVPYVAAVVDLEEGPRMMTNVEGCDHDALEIGMPLVVDFRVETDEVTVPVFRPKPRHDLAREGSLERAVGRPPGLRPRGGFARPEAESHDAT